MQTYPFVWNLHDRPACQEDATNLDTQLYLILATNRDVEVDLRTDISIVKAGP